VLCTPTKTYDLRQVQTSNTVFVVRPQSVHNDDTTAEETALCAFAKCSSALELHPQLQDEKNKVKTARELLDVMLRSYHGFEDDPAEDDPGGLSKAELFEDIPYSQGECEAAWLDLLAFERHHTCWKPEQHMLNSLWPMILQSATADGMDLTSKFHFDSLRLAMDEPPAPNEALAALMAYLCQTGGAVTGSLSLAKEITVDWTCKMVTTSRDRSSTVRPEELLNRWKDSLPEVWRAEATLEKVEQTLAIVCQDNPSGAPARAAVMAESAKESDTTKRAAPKGRDWHARFKKSRK
jgi:sister chromatid cohesion protein DCC1